MYCTPEINASESIVDFRWRFPVDCQWCFPTEIHLSCSGMFQRTLTFPVDFTGIVQWIFSDIFRWNFTFVISGVNILP